MRSPTVFVLLSFFLLSSALSAQLGRAGSEWQTDQALEKEEQARFLVEVERMSEEEYLSKALAWANFELGDSEIRLTGTLHIQDAAADRKATSEELSDGETPGWVIRYGKKTPRILTLTLTDGDRTQVKCSMKDLASIGSGYVGIFQHEHELLCITRGLGAS